MVSKEAFTRATKLVSISIPMLVQYNDAAYTLSIGLLYS